MGPDHLKVKKKNKQKKIFLDNSLYKCKTFIRFISKLAKNKSIRKNNSARKKNSYTLIFH